MGRNLKSKKESDSKFIKNHKKLLLGSVFLITTSAIGSAFLTQAAVSTSQFFASFAFAVSLSTIIDIGAQVNIWCILIVTGSEGQEISNKVVPGLGTIISILVAFDGLALNIGNIAGAGLGLDAIFGLDVKWGATITAIFAVLIFISKGGQKTMDVVSMILGIVMVLVVAYVMFVSNPPYGDAFMYTFTPEHPIKLVLPIIALVGGTVGGYITLAGAHRILDSDIKGKQYLSFVNQSAIADVLTTGIMRALLFLMVLGVVVTDVTLSPENPPASVFERAVGPIGKNISGIVLFAAAMSSVIGSTYTGATFLKTLHKLLNGRSNLIVTVSIVISTVIFLSIGRPVNLLIIVGAINGWILPITLGAILVTSKKKSVVGNYKHPNWIFIFGIVTALVTILTGIFSFREILQLF